MPWRDSYRFRICVEDINVYILICFCFIEEARLQAEREERERLERERKEKELERLESKVKKMSPRNIIPCQSWPMNMT